MIRVMRINKIYAKEILSIYDLTIPGTNLCKLFLRTLQKNHKMIQYQYKIEEIR